VKTGVKQLSKEMRENQTPHLFFVFDADGHFEYYGLLADGDACEIIERLAKDHGGEVIDRVVDKMIEDGEWPETIR
jgi:hypothetical protein